jgi:hypothetical protein
MALQNNPHLYSGGNVRLDSSPYTNFAIQLMAKKKAEDDALDQYYSKLPSTINGAGMRDIDRENFAKGMDGIMSYWKQNKDAIKNPRKDGGASQFEYEKMIRAQRDDVDASKMAGKIDLELGKLRMDGKSNHIFEDSENIEAIKLHHLPVKDPNHKTIDLYRMATPPAPLTAKDLETEAKVIVGDMKPGKTVVGQRSLGGLKLAFSNKYEFTPDALQQMGQRAEVLYSNPNHRADFHKRYLEIISDENHDAALKPLVETYSKVYGKPPTTEKQFYVAEKLMKYGASRMDETIGDDTLGKMKVADQYARGLISLRDKYAKARIDYKAKADAKEQAGVLNQFIEDQYNAGIVEEKIPGGKVRTTQVVSHNGKKYEGTEVGMPKSVAGQFAYQDDKKEWVFPDRFVITNDKKHVIPIFSKDGARNKPITMQQYRLLLGKDLLTKSKLGNEVNDTEDETELEGIANDF